jgi:hypothetical protein
LIQLTDFLDLGFQPVVIPDPLLYELLLLRAKTNVSDLATGFAHRQNQNGMAFAASALGAPGFMTDYAV